jgi:hypothetical protein
MLVNVQSSDDVQCVVFGTLDSDRLLHIFDAPQPLIDLIIDSVELPETLSPGHSVRIGFTVLNRLTRPTSGVIQGSLTQGPQIASLSATWFQPGATITDLQAGQDFSGTVELNRWNGFKPNPGAAQINLQYWVKTRTAPSRLSGGSLESSSMMQPTDLKKAGDLIVEKPPAPSLQGDT